MRERKTLRAKGTEDERVKRERPEKEETGQECTDECVVLRAIHNRDAYLAGDGEGEKMRALISDLFSVLSISRIGC